MKRLLLAVALGCQACSGNSNNDAATDTGAPMDGASDATGDAPSEAAPEGGVVCGTARPDVSGIGATEGLAIGPDGTIYYSQPGGVGRMRPGMAQEDSWVTLPPPATASATVWGIALDVPNQKLYTGSPSTHRVYVVDLTMATPSATALTFSAGQPNGFTMGPDGAMYYDDFGGGQVYRVDPMTMMRTTVTTAAIPQANDLVFGPDGSLYVDNYRDGVLVKLTLTGGHETARSVVAMNLGNPDGLMMDAMGRFYVTDNPGSGGRLIRLDPDGSNPTVLLMNITSAAAIEFGAGALSCTDIYVANQNSLIQYEMGTTPGADVPWHHAH